MERITIAATGRRKEEDPDVVRAEGKIPAVVYGGARKESTSLSVERRDFVRSFKKIKPSTVVDLAIDGDATPVLVGEVQLDPLTDDVIHIDFRQLDMKKSVKTTIALNFIGEAPAVRMLGGVLLTNRNQLAVEALPEKLIDEIDVDLSTLRAYSDAISVGDIALPEGVTSLEDDRIAIALVRPPKKVKEEKVEAEEGVEGAEGEESAGEGEKKEGAEEKADGEEAKKEDKE